MDLHPESAKLFVIDKAVEKAKDTALRLLSRRAYTRREVHDKLVQRKCAPAAIQSALETLERLGLIDDRGFARRFVAERLRVRPMGRPLLVRDLKRRGVPEKIIEEVLEEALADVDIEAVACELLRGRASRYRGLPRDKALARMFGFLGRRGFPAGIAREAAQRIWLELGDAVDEDASENDW